MAKKFKEFKIRRKKWLRGNARDGGLLRNENGSMCCLGFVARAVKIPCHQLEYKGYPSELDKSCIIDYPQEIIDYEYEFVRLNDAKGFSLKERERRLKELFNSVGWNPIFVD